MKQRRIIGFLGPGYVDLCIYLAQMLKQLSYEVLVVDNSLEQEIIHCVSRPKQSLPVFSYCGVDYEEVVFGDQLKDRNYDFVLVFMGAYPTQKELLLCQEIFLMTGCERRQMERYRTFMKQIHIPMNVVLRGISGGKIAAKRIYDFLEQENVFVVERFFVPLDPADEMYRVFMQYEELENYEELSKAYCRILVRIVAMLTGKSRTMITSGLMRIKKGE